MKRRLFILGSLLGALSITSVEGEARSDEPAPFVVIIHSQNAYVTLERSFVADAFLKKTTRWPNGEVIKPVDLSVDAATREKFSRVILKRSVSAVKSYWQQIIFSGRDVPPPEVASDEEVVKYVTSHAGSIGYVSAGAKLGDARVVVLRD